MALPVVVDENDVVTGTATKKEALEKGLIQRIVRIFIFDAQGNMLIQKRAEHVSSSPGKWDQAVGGHVEEGESYEQAARREAHEELGLENIELTEAYKALQQDGRRKRFNMVYRASTNDPPVLDADEVGEIRWIALDELDAWMTREPGAFTDGFIRNFRLLRAR